MNELVEQKFKRLKTNEALKKELMRLSDEDAYITGTYILMVWKHVNLRNLFISLINSDVEVFEKFNRYSLTIPRNEALEPEGDNYA